MDKRLANARRPRRNALSPDLESLEGRRLMTAAATPRMRVQEIAAADGVRLVIQGTQRADAIKIDDNGTATKGNITLSMTGGRTYTSKKAITTITVLTQGGKDMVAYNLTGDLTAKRGLTVELGTGADQFLATIDKDINTKDSLAILAYGDTGNDQLRVVQTGDTLAGTFFPYLQGNEGNDLISYTGTGDIGTGAIVAPGLPGDAGNDTIAADYYGVISGTYLYNLTIDGGAGDDILANRIHVKSGSWGRIGSADATPAMVMGGDGNDKIVYEILADTMSSVFETHAAILGGNGQDMAQRTSTVNSDASNETVTVV